MEKKSVLHVNGGDGSLSYAKNSGLQKFGMLKTLQVLDEALKDMSANNSFTKGFKMVDLGCASGPNTLLVISHIVDTVKNLCKPGNLPEYEIYLNDITDNDFNNLFKMLPGFHKGRKNCFVFGLPGSFYGRLLPRNSLHLAYSCNSLHWLSQVPEGVERNNKENFCICRTSPGEVLEAYAEQYRIDFWRFLKSRGEEMVSGGYMVFTSVGRNSADYSSEDVLGSLRLLAETLADMVSEGLVNEDDLHSFNAPLYTPCRQEVEEIIRQEGSFNLCRIEAFEVPWDANGYEDDDGQVFDKYKSGKQTAASVRAAMEPKLVHHFSNAIDIDGVFERYARKVTEHVSEERPSSSYHTLLVSLNRK